jgi:predicted O-methyltransferase YrrM
MHLDLRRNTIIESTHDFLQNNEKISIYSDVQEPPGKEHYYFLASIGLQIKDSKIMELGTHHGRSAYTLYYGNRVNNSNNQITTYDINRIIIDGIFDNTTINYKIEDLFDPVIREQNRDAILSSDIIFIDIDPHEGVLEYDMYLWLKQNNYAGLILFDDVHLGPGHMGVTTGNSMQQFWDKIEDQYKLDFTSVGHWSGTGLVSFHFENHTILRDE